MKPKYIHDEIAHNLTDPMEIVPFIIELLDPKSIVDVGCGIGTFLNSFKKHGVQDVLGVDGSWVNKELLHKHILPSEFLEKDLEKPINLSRKFDLVVSLEVVEHLAQSSANTIVASLANAGDVILFSAAIPGQGGQNHINEQWLGYWQEKFQQHEYVLHDVVRPYFWSNDKVAPWYKQNMVLFAKKDFKFKKPLPPSNPIPNIVHPVMFNSLVQSTWFRFGRMSRKEKIKNFIPIILNKLFTNKTRA